MAIRSEQRASGMPMMRTCVGCKERAVKSSLLRLVAVGDSVRPDPRARLPGRGAYLHPSLACLGLAQRRRVFSRALRTPGSLSLMGLAEYLGGAEAPE
ncbi:MAG: YlxR family protein [Actinomycetota bacterium]|nr:YlxR family protein [Actinomycetota bacterium]